MKFTLAITIVLATACGTSFAQLQPTGTNRPVTVSGLIKSRPSNPAVTMPAATAGTHSRAPLAQPRRPRPAVTMPQSTATVSAGRGQAIRPANNPQRQPQRQPLASSVTVGRQQARPQRPRQQSNGPQLSWGGYTIRPATRAELSRAAQSLNPFGSANNSRPTRPSRNPGRQLASPAPRQLASPRATPAPRQLANPRPQSGRAPAVGRDQRPSRPRPSNGRAPAVRHHGSRPQLAPRGRSQSGRPHTSQRTRRPAQRSRR